MWPGRHPAALSFTSDGISGNEFADGKPTLSRGSQAKAECVGTAILAKTKIPTFQPEEIAKREDCRLPRQAKLHNRLSLRSPTWKATDATNELNWEGEVTN